MAEKVMYVRMPEELHEILVMVAAKEERPMAQVVRMALRAYFETWSTQ